MLFVSVFSVCCVSKSLSCSYVRSCLLTNMAKKHCQLSQNSCSKFNRSFYETRSIRMSSFGSRSSSRRTPQAANASLIHHTNGNQLHHNHNQQQTHKQLSQQNGIGMGSNGYVPCSSENGRLLQNTNGNGGRRSCIQSTQPQPLINSKPAVEMTEINYPESRTYN